MSRTYRLRQAGLPLFAALLVAGCGAAHLSPAKLRRAGVAKTTELKGQIPATLLAEVRPIGRGARFEPSIEGSVSGRCKTTLGARIAVHIEVFGANKVVLLPAGIGTRGPRTFANGRLTRARCFGDVVTLDPTGIVYVRPGIEQTLGTVFKAWGQALTATRIASFTGGDTAAYVNGRRWHGVASSIPLTPGAEIVVEIGPHVPPHQSFAFPDATVGAI